MMFLWVFYNVLIICILVLCLMQRKLLKIKNNWYLLSKGCIFNMKKGLHMSAVLPLTFIYFTLRKSSLSFNPHFCL